MSTNINKNNRNGQVTADQALHDGLLKHAATLPTILVAGTPVPSADIAAALQRRIDLAKAVLSSRATWRAAVQDEKDERASTKALVSTCRQAISLSYAGQVDTLADFGLTPRKVRVVTPEEKVIAAAKAKATRAARHTMGSKQKAAIKGTLAPTPAPAGSAQAPAPAPAAPPAPPAPAAATAVSAAAPVTPAATQAAALAVPPPAPRG